MNTTLRNLLAGATYNAFYAARAQPYIDQLQAVPGAPYATGVASATGTLTLDLPVGQEMLVQGPNGYAKRVLNSTTKGGSP